MLDQEVESELASPICTFCGAELEVAEEEEEETTT